MPDRVMIAIPPAKGQAGDYYGKLNGGDPLSVPLIRDDITLINGMDPVLMDMRSGKVQFCYGSWILGSSRPMALLYPVRALLNGGEADPELGPFGDDAGLLPRPSYRALGGLEPPCEAPETVCSLVCFFIRRELCGKGVTVQLLAATIVLARKNRARVIEAYPVAPDSRATASWPSCRRSRPQGSSASVPPGLAVTSCG